MHIEHITLIIDCANIGLIPNILDIVDILLVDYIFLHNADNLLLIDNILDILGIVLVLGILKCLFKNLLVHVLFFLLLGQTGQMFQ